MTLLKLASEIAHNRVEWNKTNYTHYVGKAKDKRDEYDLTVDTLRRCISSLYAKMPKTLRSSWGEVEGE